MTVVGAREAPVVFDRVAGLVDMAGATGRLEVTRLVLGRAEVIPLLVDRLGVTKLSVLGRVGATKLSVLIGVGATKLSVLIGVKVTILVLGGIDDTILLVGDAILSMLAVLLVRRLVVEEAVTDEVEMPAAFVAPSACADTGVADAWLMVVLTSPCGVDNRQSLV